VTEDELIDAIRRSVAAREVPQPAVRETISETEQITGYGLPPLLVRLLMEVANGGFGPRRGVYGVRGHDGFSADIFTDMTEAALVWTAAGFLRRRTAQFPTG